MKELTMAEWILNMKHVSGTCSALVEHGEEFERGYPAFQQALRSRRGVMRCLKIRRKDGKEKVAQAGKWCGEQETAQVHLKLFV